MLFASYDFFKSIILYLLLTSIFSLKTDVSVFRNKIAFPKYVDSVHFTLKVLYILLSLKHLYFIYLFEDRVKGMGRENQWLVSPMPVIAGLLLAKGRLLGSQSVSPTTIRGTWLLEPSLEAS